MEDNNTIKVPISQVFPKPMVDYFNDNKETLQESLARLIEVRKDILDDIKSLRKKQADTEAKMDMLRNFINMVYEEY